MECGKFIKKQREAKEISQAELARLTGVSYSYISYIEAGKRPPTAALCDKISSTLGIDPDRLMILSGRVPDWLLKKLSKEPDLIGKIKEL